MWELDLEDTRGISGVYTVVMNGKIPKREALESPNLSFSTIVNILDMNSMVA